MRTMRIPKSGFQGHSNYGETGVWFQFLKLHLGGNIKIVRDVWEAISKQINVRILLLSFSRMNCAFSTIRFFCFTFITFDIYLLQAQIRLLSIQGILPTGTSCIEGSVWNPTPHEQMEQKEKHIITIKIVKLAVKIGSCICLCCKNCKRPSDWMSTNECNLIRPINARNMHSLPSIIN